MWMNQLFHCVNYVHAAVISLNVYSVKRINKNSFFLSFFQWNVSILLRDARHLQEVERKAVRERPPNHDCLCVSIDWRMELCVTMDGATLLQGMTLNSASLTGRRRTKK
jgi:hypothetical protein